MSLIRRSTEPLEPMRSTDSVLEDLNVAIGRIKRLRETAIYLLNEIAEGELTGDDRG